MPQNTTEQDQERHTLFTASSHAFFNSVKLALLTLTSSLSDAGTVTASGPKGRSAGSGLGERAFSEVLELTPFGAEVAVDFPFGGEDDDGSASACLDFTRAILAGFEAFLRDAKRPN